MIRVGIELTDKNISGVDLSNPQNGNPGVGGSEYLFAMLGYYLCKNYKDNIDITFFHYTHNRLPDSANEILIEDEYDMIEKMESGNIDVIIHQVSKSTEWYEKLSQTDLKAISWAHVYPLYDEICSLKHCKNVKRVVCVGKEEYDSYIDNDIIKKTTYIYNMLNTHKDYLERDLTEKNVTYIGSLVPAKGFHVLAEVWPNIISKVPDAKLNVIGTGKVYDRNAKLGKYRIAQEDYEKSFIKYLTDDNGNILPSVNFLGLLGEEKDDVFIRTKVGIANPTALTETFCMSAVEMELCGIPVVAKKKWGLLDTIKTGRTGYLFKNNREFVDSVVSLLVDDELNMQMSKNAVKFVKDTFEAEDIIKRWQKVITDVKNDIDQEYYGISENLLNDNKWIKAIIRYLRFTLKMSFLPDFETIKFKLKSLRK